MVRLIISTEVENIHKCYYIIVGKVYQATPSSLSVV